MRGQILCPCVVCGITSDEDGAVSMSVLGTRWTRYKYRWRERIDGVLVAQQPSISNRKHQRQHHALPGVLRIRQFALHLLGFLGSRSALHCSISGLPCRKPRHISLAQVVTCTPRPLPVPFYEVTSLQDDVFRIQFTMSSREAMRQQRCYFHLSNAKAD